MKSSKPSANELGVQPPALTLSSHSDKKANKGECYFWAIHSLHGFLSIFGGLNLLKEWGRQGGPRYVLSFDNLIEETFKVPIQFSKQACRSAPHAAFPSAPELSYAEDYFTPQQRIESIADLLASIALRIAKKTES